MISRSTHVALWRVLRKTFYGALIATTLAVIGTIAFRWYQGIGSLEDTRSRVLLTLIGVVVGAWLARICAAGAGKHHRFALAGLAAIALSQVFYLTLVWSEWKSHVGLWRAWWVTLICALGLTHVVWLWLIGARHSTLSRATRIAAGAATIALASLALRRNLLDDIPQILAGLIALSLAATFVGSAILWIQMRRRKPKRAVSRWQKLAWVISAQLAVFVFGFYAGRTAAPVTAVVDMEPSPLAHLTPDELDAQLAADLNRLRIVSAGIDELGAKSERTFARISETRSREKRDYFLPSEEDEIRAQFMSYLAYRAALLRLVATYGNFQSIARPDARARCFLVGYGAGANVMRASTLLATTYGKEPAIRRKLNEADAACGMRAGEFDRIYDAVASDRNAVTFEEMAGYFRAHRDRWRREKVLADEQLAWVEGQIERAIEDVKARRFDRSRARWERIIARVGSNVYVPVYDVRSVVSTLIGDTRIVKRPPFIAHAQVKAMQSQLQPGDILLERRNWYASNAFLPGFWPHAAIYVGTPRDLQRLGLIAAGGSSGFTASDPQIQQHLDAYLKPAHDGEAHTVLESVSEGVIFNSLTESMGADYVAVLRPRLSDAQKAQAIARAFAHVGKPYDFEFDFFSSDKLVCTELVYRSYEGLIDFDLVKIMGRDTLPALEICKKFAAERGRADRQLDFVLFLDAVPQDRTARLATVDDFVASAHRPRGFNE
ncbi:MAG TPA: YiiX/YebB-like N1pC/P60 family cysteine hydrolase [Tepidisphaeraceae bacterium]|nr:YiiX/YebB-like N1pC/P60 family cysteine hydrolase [Tepidisphaeraceae bacterium]